jgi:hypothetical protein
MINRREFKTTEKSGKSKVADPSSQPIANTLQLAEIPWTSQQTVVNGTKTKPNPRSLLLAQLLYI